MKIEPNRKKLLGIGAFIFVILINAFFLQRLILDQTRIKTVVDNQKSEIKSLSGDAKRKLLSASPSASIRVPLLLYHYVEYVQDKKDTIRQSLNIDPSIFDNQVKTLKNAGYSFITAKMLGDILDGKMQLPDKPIILTFDDGHWDFYTSVLPILKKYNVDATAYIISGFIGGSDFMSSDQLQSVISSGLVDIGAHTVHHISLKKKPFLIVKKEIQDSKTALEQKYHINITSFAYPNGSFDQQAAQEVKDAGFETAVSTIPGTLQSQNNRFFLYRIRPGRRMGNALLNYIAKSS